MKNLFLVTMACFLFAACGDDRSLEATVTAIDGKDGEPGEPGAPGAPALQPGLSCNVHDMSSWSGITSIVTALTQSTPVGNFVLPNLSAGSSTAGLPSSGGFPGMPPSIRSLVGDTGYALDCTGFLEIDTSGVYQFTMLSDDGVRLMIDNTVIINNPGLHPPTYNVSALIELQKGRRAFNVVYYQGPHTQIALELKYSGPHVPIQVIPPSKFTHN